MGNGALSSTGHAGEPHYLCSLFAIRRGETVHDIVE
jgi:hypothetical protein